LAFTAAWNWISQTAVDAWEWIKTTWSNVTTWFKENVIDPLVAFWKPVFEFIAILANNAWVTIKYIWGIVYTWFKEHVINPLSNAFSYAWNWIKVSARLAWSRIKIIWSFAKNWFKTKVIDPLKKLFGPALGWIKDKWEETFTGIKDFVKGIINSLIGLINGMLKGMAGGLNSLVDGLNKLGNVVPGWKIIPTIVAPQIPKLATGAVIPPNSAFAAILGDQKSGTNIETPENLLRQIVREEGGGNREITLRFDGTMGALIRKMKPYIDDENKRIGKSLISGVTA